MGPLHRAFISPVPWWYTSLQLTLWLLDAKNRGAGARHTSGQISAWLLRLTAKHNKAKGLEFSAPFRVWEEVRTNFRPCDHLVRASSSPPVELDGITRFF
jgi:hypothetical protein